MSRHSERSEKSPHPRPRLNFSGFYEAASSWQRPQAHDPRPRISSSTLNQIENRQSSPAPESAAPTASSPRQPSSRPSPQNLSGSILPTKFQSCRPAKSRTQSARSSTHTHSKPDTYSCHPAAQETSPQNSAQKLRFLSWDSATRPPKSRRGFHMPYTSAHTKEMHTDTQDKTS